jgi:GNAT superfamily N-acetyltransferase
LKFSLSELCLRELSADEMREIYNSHMIHVFPENELKPCDEIYKEMLENKFLACGLYAGGELVAYMFTACIPGRPQLFGQYVVVMEQYRSMGVGGVLLDKVCEHYAGYRCIMADVEDPEFSVDEADFAQRQRRMRFYMRNGFRHTRVKGHVYGVDYEVIVRNISAEADDAEVFEAANAIYESMAAPGAFPDMFQVRIDEK